VGVIPYSLFPIPTCPYGRWSVGTLFSSGEEESGLFLERIERLRLKSCAIMTGRLHGKLTGTTWRLAPDRMEVRIGRAVRLLMVAQPALVLFLCHRLVHKERRRTITSANAMPLQVLLVAVVPRG